MDTGGPADVPTPGRPAEMATLRAALAAAGYNADGVRSLLLASRELGLGPPELQVHDRRTRGGSRLETLTRLFALGFEVGEDALAAALPGVSIAALVAMRLLELEGGRVRGLARLHAHGDVLVACDRPGAGGANHVTGVNGPALLLAGLAVRRPCARMLDLGTGNGIQGLLAARHCRRVVATDVNPRALAFAEFNAALNNVTNLETRLGSLYEPVAHERFGLILANPPYVVSPESSLVYRDSGGAPGAICREVVHGAGPRLDEGGFAQVLVSWPVVPGGRWDEVPRTWVPGGADAWLLHYQTEDALTHAGKWNRAAGDAEVAARGRVLDEWLAYYRREGIKEIAFGAVFLHRLAGGGRVLTTEGRSGAAGAGRQVQRVFTALAAAELDDADLGATVFAPVPELRVEQEARPDDGGGWVVDRCSVRLAEGVGHEGSVDATLASLLMALDGRTTLDAAISATGGRVGLDPGELRGPALAMARGLHSLGFLVRVEDPPALG